jgi:hypothetical protein
MANYERQVLLASTAPQTLTASFVDVGGEMNVENYKQLWLYFDVDINSSNNVTFQVLSKGLDGNWYYLPVETAGTAKTLVDPSVYELNVDADQKQTVKFPVVGACVVKVQVKAGTLGSPAAIILSAEWMACEWMDT